MMIDGGTGASAGENIAHSGQARCHLSSALRWQQSKCFHDACFDLRSRSHGPSITVCHYLGEFLKRSICCRQCDGTLRNPGPKDSNSRQHALLQQWELHLQQRPGVDQHFLPLRPSPGQAHRCERPHPTLRLQNWPLPSAELEGGTSPIAGGAAGTFFYDHTTLYAYGGIIGGNANGTQNGLWTYNTLNGSWGLTIVEGGLLSFGDDTEGAFANDPDHGLSFYTGGWEMAYNNTNNGLVKFDSSNPEQPSWNFETAQPGSRMWTEGATWMTEA